MFMSFVKRMQEIIENAKTKKEVAINIFPKMNYNEENPVTLLSKETQPFSS